MASGGIFQELTKQLDWTSLNDLRIHIARDKVLILAKGQDIVQCAVAMYKDDKKKIQSYVENKKISKPSLEDIAKWEREKSKLQCLVISPFVLVQEVG